MALILTVIETRKGVISRESLAALAVGRQVASARGATLYAVLLLSSYERMQQDLIVQLSAYRADRVIVVTQVSDPPCFQTWVPVLKTVFERFRPTFLLFGATRLAQELAPPLCLHLQGVYVPDCNILVTQQLKVEWVHPRDRTITEFFEEDLESTLVALVRPDLPSALEQAAELEVVLMQTPVVVAPKDIDVFPQEHVWGADVSVVLGSLAQHRADELARWCQKQEFSLIRMGSGPTLAVPWWRAEPAAGKGLLLIGCTTEECTLCEEVFPLFSRWICIGCAAVSTHLRKDDVYIVTGELDDTLDTLLQKEL